MLITHRSIPLDRAEDYARLWREVRHQVSHAGGRAWMFRALNAGHRFVEFVEWQSDEEHPLIGRPDIAMTLDALDEAFPAKDSETWIEAKI